MKHPVKTSCHGRGAGIRVSAPVLVVLILGHASAMAGLTQNDVVGAGGLLSVVAGLTTGGNPDPGFNQSNVDEDSFAGAGTASAGVAFSQSTHIASGSGTSGLGFVDVTAASESTFDFTSFFAVGVVHGGWSDTITVTAPGLAGEAAV